MSTSQPTRIHPTFIGVIHLPALPGDAYGSLGDYEPSYQAALNDAKALLAGGVEGIIVENFGSAPFQRGTRQDPAPPHQIAALTVVARELQALSNTVQIGVNCLRNDAIAALGIAAALLRYRRQLGAEHIKIFADVLVKHASPVAPLTIEQAALDTWKRGGADALIISGTGTGEPVSDLLLREAQEAVRYAAPIYIGSGLSHKNLHTLAPLASGAIVGTALKEGGALAAPVSVDRVREMKEALSAYW